jgi:uncharacterized protein YbjQ (UPF0145 family)
MATGGTKQPGRTQVADDETAGTLPPDARGRLDELAETEGKAGLFTSDLSVNEFMLVKECGFHPRGLVFGSSIFNVGIARRSWSRNEEMTTYTQAMYSARELAMQRMETEAELLGADGVVGVRLDINYYDWGRRSAEFIAIGTAVSADTEGAWKTTAGKPFTSDLSGQDFWTLLQMEYVPVGLVLGNCVYHVGHRSPRRAVNQLARSTEMPTVTQALYEARELAMARMQQDASEMGAEGIVGVQLVEKSHMLGKHVIEFLAVGTGVRAIGERAMPPTPQLVLTLDR